MYDYNSKLAAAQELAKHGLAVFPCHAIEDGKCSCGKADCGSPAKHPLTENGSKDATKDDDTLKKYFTGDYKAANIAVATGKVSNVFVVDEDVPGAIAALEAAHGALPKTPTVSTGKGSHRYFRLPDGIEIPNSQGKLGTGIDVRGEGGYVIAPPSIHHSGKKYEWVTTPEETPFADAPEWLIEKVKAGYNAASPSPSPIPEKKIPSNGFSIQRARTIEDRARLYLAKTPPAISGEGGHGHTFSTACRLMEYFPELGNEAILAALDDWNSRCEPPWTTSELLHKVSSARAKVGEQPAKDYPGWDDDEDSFPTLQPEAYCGLLGEIVKVIEPETEADNAGIMLSLLASCGNVIGKGAYCTVGSDIHYANLFVTLVGDTASGKGQSWGITRRLMRQVDNGWVQSEIGYGLSSGEGFLERIADPLTDDGEAVFIIPPLKRLLCLETEFAKPITAMRREGNTLSPFLRSAWDSLTLEVMTRGKSRRKASNAHLSIVAHITPEELDLILARTIETANGFANRFLWGHVRCSKLLPSGGDHSVLDSFTDRLVAAIEYAKGVGHVSRSPEAETLWISVYPDLAKTLCKAADRGRPQVVRLSLIFAVLDHSPTIELRHLRAALAVWRYCEATAYTVFGKSDGGMLASSIRKAVREEPGIKRTDLLVKTASKNKLNIFNTSITWLERKGDIVVVPVYESRQADSYYPGIRNQELGIRVSEKPNSPNSPNSLIPNSQGETRAVDGAEFIGDLTGKVPPATLSELLDWRNVNSVDFIRRHDGCIWVTKEKAVTPPIKAALVAHADTLASFVKETPSPEVSSILEDDGIVEFHNDDDFKFFLLVNSNGLKPEEIPRYERLSEGKYRLIR